MKATLGTDIMRPLPPPSPSPPPQNWSHVETVVEALNRLPREQHGTDIMRVREWALSGLSRHYRQTVLLSSWLSPDMNRLMAAPGCCSNYQGQVRVLPREQQGVLGAVVPQVRGGGGKRGAATTRGRPACCPGSNWECWVQWCHR